MGKGFCGRLLRVDLTTGTWKTEEIPEIILRKYIGGSALASYFLIKELKPGVDPLGADNVLVFACSILNGTPLPGSTRYTVSAKSPLTGGFGESEAGGWWAPEFRKAGFDVLVIKGCSPKPVYLWVKDGNVEIRNATYLRGKTIGEAEKLIRKELGDERIIIAQTGPAGENMVRYACVLNNAKHANGRTGMGAVLGSKNLRGVAVRGTGKVQIHDKEKIKEIARWFGKNWKDTAGFILYEHGTASGVEGLNAAGILPTHNFREGQFDGAKKISGEYMTSTMLIGREGCFSCPVHCKRVVKTKGKYQVDPYYGGPEYETIASLGSLCGISDLEAVAKGNELCNKYGMDTVSTGVVIAFAMECYEKGIITSDDTGGLELNFGNADAMLQLIELIKEKEGIGSILAEGVKRAAEIFGADAQEYAMHVKGQELPLHEPRGKVGVGLGYAVSPTGADHLEAPHDPDFADWGPFLENVYPLGLLEPVDPFDLSSKKVRFFSYGKKIWDLYNSLGICNFVAAPKFALNLEKIVEAVKSVTGWQTSLWELLKVAERANTIARCINIREGFTSADDKLPNRLYQPLGNGPLKGRKIDEAQLREAIQIYYGMQGWDKNGIPRKSKLQELDLDWIQIGECI